MHSESVEGGGCLCFRGFEVSGVIFLPCMSSSVQLALGLGGFDFGGARFICFR